MESGIYICGWSQSAEGFELWVKSRPHVRARGKSYAEAEEAFLEAIIKAGGAFHAVIEFVPPLPKSEPDARYSTPELYRISGDEHFNPDEPRGRPFETEDERVTRLAWRDQFFVTTCCPICSGYRGPRNQQKLTLTYASRDGGFAYLAGASIAIFSESFLMLLSAAERERLQFQAVERPKRTRKQFFELLGPSGPAEVAVAGREISGWRCPACNRRVFGCSNPESFIQTFVARADLPDPLPSIFTVGTPPEVSLCATAERWAELVDRRGTRGLLSHPLGVVPDGEVIRTPELPVREDF